MSTFVQYTLYGLFAGSVYAIAASGLVVTYTTSGIFNFAHGAIGMLGAFSYWQLRVDWGWPAPLALFTVLVVLAPLFGAFLQRVIMRGLEGTSEIVRVVVPVAVMLFAIALATWVWNPNVSRSLPSFFGNTATVDLGDAIGVGSVPITYHQLIAFGVAIAIAVGLRLFLYRTYTGVAMRAVVDDRPLLQLNGGRPDRMSLLAWAIGCSLAALAGVLITPIQGGSLNANLLTLLVINAYAAAMVGRLRNLPLTFAGALVLGLLNSWVVKYFPTSWTWKANFRTSIPMILLFVVLLVLPQERLRGAVVTRTRERFAVPTMRTAAIWAAVLVAVVHLLSLLMEPGAVNQLSAGMTFSLIALSLVLLTGYAGEMNLGVMAFAGIGALVMWHSGTPGGTGPDARTAWYGYVLAAVVTAVVGTLVALPALRLRGLYLGLATAAFGVFVSNMILGEPYKRLLRLPGFDLEFSLFPGGSMIVPRPSLGPLDFNGDRPFLMLVTVLFAALGLTLVALRRSSYGRRLTAMKDSPAASATLGLSTVRLKLSVFAVSAAIAGFAGALYAAQLQSITPERFILFTSMSLFMLTVAGGIGNVSGALFGGVLLAVSAAALPDSFTKLGTDHPSLEALFDWLSDFTTLLPAIIGINLGRNPSGAVSEIVEGTEPLGRIKAAIVAMVALLAGAWLLAHQDIISNWWFVVAVAAIMIGVPQLARLLRPEAFWTPEQLEARRANPFDLGALRPRDR